MGIDVFQGGFKFWFINFHHQNVSAYRLSFGKGLRVMVGKNDTFGQICRVLFKIVPYIFILRINTDTVAQILIFKLPEQVGKR